MYVRLSHPFVGRLVGTIRPECLDGTLFWDGRRLGVKLFEFQLYFNNHRALGRATIAATADVSGLRAALGSYR